MMVQVLTAGGVLKIDGREALLPVDDRTFKFEPYPSFGVLFRADAAGRVTGLQWTGFDGASDAFTIPSVGTFVFDRGGNRTVVGFRLFSGRVGGLRFDRQAVPKAARPGRSGSS